MGTWMDPDGLYHKYGTTKTTANVGGEYKNYGQLREIELTIDLTALTQTETIVSDQVNLPTGMRIQEIETITKTAAATGTAIDLGLTKMDRTTEGDYDGLLAAAPIANFNSAGERSLYQVAVTVPTGLTGTGAVVGTTTTYPSYISCSRTDATAFTTGVLIVKIRYYKP